MCSQEPIIDADGKTNQIDNIVKYWRMHRGTHTSYALTFFVCELLNFVNVVGQVDILRNRFGRNLRIEHKLVKINFN
jgi:hypothetical protein